MIFWGKDWLFKPGRIEFYPSSPCCFNLDSVDWKFRMSLDFIEFVVVEMDFFSVGDCANN